jgi:fructose/tagatose bisphosphate aldolase
MRILSAAELQKHLDATCVFDRKGKLKPESERHGLLALNVYADAWLIGAMAASAKLKSPVILESSPRVFGQWGSGEPLAGVFDAYAYLENAAKFGGQLDKKNLDGKVLETIPFAGATVALAADHVSVPKRGADFNQKMRKLLDYAEGAIPSGRISYFMIDAGSLPLPENISLTRDIVQMGHENDVLVEGEFSVIGGIEDSQTFAAGEAIPVEDHAQGIAHFVEETNVDVVAYDFGTLHGAKSDQKQTINVELLHRVNELLHDKGIWRPTTGHGGTSMSDEDARAERGWVSKLNKATIGKVVATRYMRDYFARHGAGVDTEDKNVCDPGRLIYDVAGPLADMCENFIRLIGAANRA